MPIVPRKAPREHGSPITDFISWIAIKWPILNSTDSRNEHMVTLSLSLALLIVGILLVMPERIWKKMANRWKFANRRNLSKRSPRSIPVLELTGRTWVEGADPTLLSLKKYVRFATGFILL